jgi:hypothetical protein
MATQHTNKKLSGNAKIAIGATAIALAAATYYFFGPKGKQHRQTLKGWMIKMKGEVVERMEKAKDMTEGLYYNIIDAVAAKYGKGIPETDVNAFVTELKSGWKRFAASHAPQKKASGRTSVTGRKKAAKKASAKKRSA